MKSIEELMNGKVAIVTGGNTGIGLGCAKCFVEAGMKVVISARREELGVEEAKKLTEMGPGEAVFFKCDVSEPFQVKALVDFAVEKYGQLDAIVNNAGYVPAHLDACDMPIESYQKVLETNLMGEFYGSLTQTLSIEEARHGVRVNAICPGHIITELFEMECAKVADPEAYAERCNNYSWMGRGGTPEEIGTAALFLISPWAGYINGVCLNVSGGMEFGTIPKYYAFDASEEKMKHVSDSN